MKVRQKVGKFPTWPPCAPAIQSTEFHPTGSAKDDVVDPQLRGTGPGAVRPGVHLPLDADHLRRRRDRGARRIIEERVGLSVRGGGGRREGQAGDRRVAVAARGAGPAARIGGGSVSLILRLQL